MDNTRDEEREPSVKDLANEHYEEEQRIAWETLYEKHHWDATHGMI